MSTLHTVRNCGPFAFRFHIKPLFSFSPLHSGVKWLRQMDIKFKPRSFLVLGNICEHVGCHKIGAVAAVNTLPITGKEGVFSRGNYINWSGTLVFRSPDQNFQAQYKTWLI